MLVFSLNIPVFPRFSHRQIYQGGGGGSAVRVFSIVCENLAVLEEPQVKKNQKTKNIN